AAMRERRRKLDELSLSLTRLGQADLVARKDRLAALDRLRETLGYRATLRRGYAVVRGDGDVVTSAAAARAARALEIEFADGRMVPGGGGGGAGGGAAGAVPGGAAPGASGRARTRRKEAPPEQGDLF
ncbi:Exonuclease VII, large subunit, partial [Oceanicola granulosus HTCC2516]